MKNKNHPENDKKPSAKHMIKGPGPLPGQPDNPERRQMLRAIVAAGMAAGMAGAGGEALAMRAGGGSPSPALPDSKLDALMHRHIEKLVVIYAENRSFNNLFAAFPGLERPLEGLTPEQYRQRDRDGKILKELPPVWGGLVPNEQVVEHLTFKIGERDLPPLPNRPFALATPEGDPLPHGLVTRDLIHAFYHNQAQINDGRNDGFVAWGDSGALVMGHYGDGAANLRLWSVAREFTLCDNFFMGAFGGSFLNHQYLVAAQPPFYPAADKSPAKEQIAHIEGDDPKGIKLVPLKNSPASAMAGPPSFGPNTLSPDFWAVNTMGPPFQPGLSVDPGDPARTDPENPRTLPPQVHKTIGDMMSAGGVEWAWYAGGWAAALAGHGYDDEFPSRPNFQAHHQPFNYFAGFAPGTAARARHLRDAGEGETPRTNHFLADAAAGRLPSVSYYKPQGNLNMHAGYSDVDAGDRHIARVIEALRKSPDWNRMLIIVTFDENGGWWDHVAPPRGDRWGPGSRIPALLISPHVRKGHVDHTLYDTGSVARFITRRFGLEKLPGLLAREAAMAAAGGPPPGDLTASLDFRKL